MQHRGSRGVDVVFVQCADLVGDRNQHRDRRRRDAAAVGERRQPAGAALGGQVAAAQAAQEPDEEQRADRPQQAGGEDPVAMLLVVSEDLGPLLPFTFVEMRATLATQNGTASAPDSVAQRSHFEAIFRTPFGRIGGRIISLRSDEFKAQIRHEVDTPLRRFLCCNGGHEEREADGAPGLRARGGALRAGRRGVSGDAGRGLGADRAPAGRERASRRRGSRTCHCVQRGRRRRAESGRSRVASELVREMR